jgi:membrane protein YqaA with SNARE-associated domain
MSGLVEAMLALGYGFASALVPVVNAEAYAVVAGEHSGHGVVAGEHSGHAVVAGALCGDAVLAVLALALGQTAGKLLLFESARRGTGSLSRRLSRRKRSGGAAARAGRWAAPVRRWLSRRRTGLPTVLVSATLGVPPLAVVSFAAGAVGLNRWEFSVACGLGRVIRFAVLALPLALT